MKTLVAAGAALLFSSVASQAAIVDFEELTPFITYGSPLESGGLVFANEGAGGGVDAFYPVGDGWISGTDGVQLVPNFFGSVTTVSLAGGGLFDLIGFEFSDAFDYADDPIVLTLTLNTEGGPVVLEYEADFNYGLQYAAVNVTGISSFTLVASGSFFGEDTVALDNIEYVLSDVGPGVPEPATWAMLISGFGLVGAAARRRRLATSA